MQATSVALMGGQSAENKLMRRQTEEQSKASKLGVSLAPVHEFEDFAGYDGRCRRPHTIADTGKPHGHPQSSVEYARNDADVSRGSGGNANDTDE